MELCLYHPEHGYYERPDLPIGRKGDFYTSVSVGSVFGELLSWQFLSWMRAELKPPYQILEAGAHDGQLADDILTSLASLEPDFLDHLEYIILEPSAGRQARQTQTLAKHEKNVRWIKDWNEAPEDGVNGVIFSNELLDAMPVDQVGWDAETSHWFEWRVALDGDRFARVRGPVVEPSDLPPLVQPFRPDDDAFTLEVRNESFRWWRAAAKALHAGCLLTLDYGLEFEEYTAPDRKHGTLRAYRDHQLVTDIFDSPGEQDLTAHIDLTELRSIGVHAGLNTDPPLSQGRWLNRMLARMQQESTPFPEWTSKRLRQFQTLSHPDHLGEKFRVLCQRKP